MRPVGSYMGHGVYLLWSHVPEHTRRFATFFMPQTTLEQPGTGALLTEHREGRFLCVACKAPLFSSTDKIPNTVDYVTFRSPIKDSAVTQTQSYTLAGDELSQLHCAHCDAIVGFIGGFELRSADDLESGETQREYKVFSAAVRLEKKWSLRNYPILALVGLALIVVGLYAGLRVYESVVGSMQVVEEEKRTRVWMGNTVLEVKAVVLTEAAANGSIPSIESGTLLLVIPPESAAIRVRLASSPFDVLWLDDTFTVLSFETIDPLLSDILTPPAGSRYALVALPGVIVSGAQQPGYQLLVLDKKNL